MWCCPLSSSLVVRPSQRRRRGCIETRNFHQFARDPLMLAYLPEEEATELWRQPTVKLQ
jgi:hypothetical protein